MVSIETWWNLTVVIDPYDERIGYDRIGYKQIGYEGPKLSADLVLITREHADYNSADAVIGNPKALKGIDAVGKIGDEWGMLDRPANTESPTWRQGQIGDPFPQDHSAHAIKVDMITARRDDLPDTGDGTLAFFVVEVDGVRIAHMGEFWPSKLTKDQTKSFGRIDILCIPIEKELEKQIDVEQAIAMIEQIKPRFLLHLDYERDLHLPSGPLSDALWAKYHTIMTPGSNTFAISYTVPQSEQSTINLIPMLKPDPLSEELASLIKIMDKSCRASQRIFEPLSANQMNWKPPNGTHTPRWNTEHMMGRQLGFFSEIYSTIDHELYESFDPNWSMIQPIDLNPKQMPPDYQAAHPDWDGAEEARQMQRANAFVQRFAYLLKGIDLDKKAPGSRWTLRELLKQMDRHFTEHTANVARKFELDGWPDK